MTPSFPTSFQRLMAQATRLTQGGDLSGATAAIQAALRGTAEPAPSKDALVIDVEAREVDDGVAAPKRPAPLAGQFIQGSYADKRAALEYRLYIPPAYQGQPLPLIVMLHGCTQDPEDFAAGTRMNEAAQESGFFVLYPAQAQNANPSRCWNWFKHNHQGRDRGEPALLAGMTRDVMSRYKIDGQRVYVAGLSAGGAMAAILGETYPEMFAAVGVHSGLPAGAATDLGSALTAMKQGTAAAVSSGRTPPTIVFHGDQDTTVHPLNGKQVAAVSAGAAQSESERVRGGQGRECTRHVYRGAGGRVVTEHWVVHGAGHAWSGGSAQGSYTDPRGPDATKEMLRFFWANPHRTQRSV